MSSAKDEKKSHPQVCPDFKGPPTDTATVIISDLVKVIDSSKITCKLRVANTTTSPIKIATCRFINENGDTETIHKFSQPVVLARGKTYINNDFIVDPSGGSNSNYYLYLYSDPLGLAFCVGYSNICKLPE